MESSKIGIVTVLYNGESVLEDFFRTLNEQTYKNFVLYLVDNASKDNSVQKGKEYEREVDFECKWLLQRENLGVAEGNNIGIKAALADKCDYVLLSNNDIVLQKDSIEKLMDGMLVMNVSMAVPKIYYWNDPKKIWMAGGGYLQLQFTTAHYGVDELDKGQCNEPVLVEYAPTCFMLIESSVFHRVGLMDKQYFVYYDDTDFVWRAIKLGTEKLAYIPTSQLWHKVSSSTGGCMSDFTIYYTERNHILFALYYCHGFRRIMFTLYLFVHFFVRKIFYFDIKQLHIVLKAHSDALKLYKRRDKKRLENLKRMVP